MKGKIAVTPRSLSGTGHPALEKLTLAGYEIVYPAPGRQPTLQELMETLPTCVGYLAGVEPVPAELLSMCPNLKVISRNGIGVDNIDLAAASKLGIVLEKAAGANSRGVAELTIALMLAGLRHIIWSDQSMKRGEWARREGIEVEDRILGVVGCGNIGKYVTSMGIGLGMRVLAHDVIVDESFKPGGDFTYTTLERLLADADVISLHCPPSQKPLIDAEAINRMKPGVMIINTARAALIDPQAVLSALESGRLLGYATDVFDHEPPEMTGLLLHQRVITTPHIGGYTQESVCRATEAAVQNLLKVLE